MNNFKKDGFRKGRGQFGGKPRFGGGKQFGGGSFGRPNGDRELFKATCASCSKLCEVPFRPSGEKPVYCRECFGKDSDGRGSSRNDSRNDFSRDARSSRRDGERPHREESRPVRDTGIDDLKRQVTNLESKVDHLITLIKSKAVTPAGTELSQKTADTTVTEEVGKKTSKPKVVKVSKVTPKAPTKAKAKAPAKKAAPKTAPKKKAK